jgi:predicted negative regulator of RcsB-dependent stress response
MLSGNWVSVPAEDQEYVFTIAEEELYRGLEQEPLNLRLNLSLASLYQAARNLDPSYLDKAQEQLDIALTLGPDRTQVLTARERLAAIKEQLEGG